MAAKAERDPKTGKWLIQYRYTDWQGNRKKSTKRGFNTKREAEEWLQKFLVTQQADFNMLFEDFLKIYYADMDTRLREHTMRTKKYIIDLKVLPYFGKIKMNEIKAADIRKWQNELIQQGYAPTYLKTINNQVAAVFNYAVKYYDLPHNPCKKAGSIGKGKADEMQFWTIAPRLKNMQGEYLIVDIGSKTVDLVLVKDGIPNESRSTSIERAIVKWIRHIQAELQSTYGRQIPENEIMKVMTEEVNNLPVDIAKSIQGLLRDFVNDLEGNITELGYDMDYTNIIYVGGGASIARKYNTKKRSNVAYDCDIKANAKGYEFLAEQMVKRWRNE